MHVLAFFIGGGLPSTDDFGASLVTAFTTAIGNYVPNIALVFGAAIGLAFLIGLGHFIIGRVRSSL